MRKSILLSLGVLLTAQTSLAVPLAPSRAGVFAGKSLKHNAAFIENWQRHPTPQMILEQMIQNLGTPGMLGEYGQLLDECILLKPESMAILGTNHPLTLKPTTPEPGDAFARWQLSCAQKIIASHRDYLYAKNEDFRRDLHSGVWLKLTAEEQRAQISAIVLQMIGDDDVLIDLQLQTVPGDLVARIQEQINQDISDKSTSYPFVMTGRPLEFMHPLEAALIARYLLYFLDWSRY